jgi:hypothetical protein
MMSFPRQCHVKLSGGPSCDDWMAHRDLASSRGTARNLELPLMTDRV